MLVRADLRGDRRDQSRARATILLVGENAYQALKIANRGYVLATGRVVLEGSGAELLSDPEICAAYLEGGH